jgi:hypothetical protein
LPELVEVSNEPVCRAREVVCIANVSTEGLALCIEYDCFARLTGEHGNRRLATVVAA